MESNVSGFGTLLWLNFFFYVFFTFTTNIVKILQKMGEIEITDLENKNSPTKKFRFKYDIKPFIWIDGKETMYVAKIRQRSFKVSLYDLNEVVKVKKFKVEDVFFIWTHINYFDNCIIFRDSFIVGEIYIYPEKNEIKIFNYPKLNLVLDKVILFTFFFTFEK